MKQMRMCKRIGNALDGTILSNDTFLCVVAALLVVGGIILCG